MNKKYENRYWLVTGENNDVYELHFTKFYDDEVILKFAQDKNDSKSYVYYSDLLKVEDDEIQADSVEDAMEQFEDKVIDHIEDENYYYEEMLNRFNKEAINI